MRHEKTLSIDFVELDDSDVVAIAGRLQSLVDEKNSIAEAELRDRFAQDRRKGETDDEFEVSVREALEDRLFKAKARFRIELKGSISTSDSAWARIWETAAKSDIRSIQLQGEGQSTEVSVGLPLEGESGRVSVTSEDPEEFNEELGYYLQLLEARRSLARRSLSLHWWTGPLLWILLPTAAVVAWYLRATEGARDLTATVNAAINLSVFVGVVLLVVADFVTTRVAPKVAIRGVGPHQGFRTASKAVLLGVVGSALFALLSVVIPAIAS